PVDDRRWRLEDERDFLTRSLADLRAEHGAGDIATRDYEALFARDEARLAAVEDELGQLEAAQGASAPADTPPLSVPKRIRRRPAWLAVVAVIALSAGTTLLVIHLASPRLPGQPLTGSIKENLTQQIQTQLAEAALLEDNGSKTSVDQALSLYQKVLSEDPSQPQALVETGWLEWQAGFSRSDRSLESKGRALIARSVKVEHDDYAAHLYLGTIDLEQGHDDAAAAAQYATFLSEHPPKSEIQSAATFIKAAYGGAGRPLPAAVVKA
ncbi:MAG: hypothetical protein ACRDVW_11145, partial [Acidimicrobiales bacterium]